VRQPALHRTAFITTTLAPEVAIQPNIMLCPSDHFMSSDRVVVIGVKEDTQAPHQFRTRKNANKTRQLPSELKENYTKSTKPTNIPPLITVWLQVRVLPGPPTGSIA
jgi:hypothetical protein